MVGMSGASSLWKYQCSARSPYEPIASMRLDGSTISISTPGRCMSTVRIWPTSFDRPHTRPHVASSSAGSSCGGSPPMANILTVSL